MMFDLPYQAYAVQVNITLSRTNICTMASFKPSDDTDVMPLVLRLLRVIGVWDVQRYRYRYAPLFLHTC